MARSRPKKTEPQSLEARQRASAQHTRQVLFSALTGAHKTEDGTLYTCPLCGGAGKLLVQTNQSDDPNYLYTLRQFCDCDRQQLAMKVMALSNVGVVHLNGFAPSG
jgi:hypothetical protein